MIYVVLKQKSINICVQSYTWFLQIKTGLINCVLHIIVLQLAVNTWGKAFFRFDIYPDWAPRSDSGSLFNATTITP